MHIENCCDKRVADGIQFQDVRPLPTRGIKLYQSESESSTDNILEYYQGPNHIVIEGFGTLPFTFMVQRDGSITQWNEIAAQATPVPNEPYVAVLVVGCFSVDGNSDLLGTPVNHVTQQQKDAIAFLKEQVKELYKANLPLIYADTVAGSELHTLCRELNS